LLTPSSGFIVLMMEAARTSETLVNFYQTALLPSSGFIALMMEAARTSETLVNFYQTTRRYNLEDSHLRIQDIPRNVCQACGWLFIGLF
jgi:hypothetical protein